MIFSSTIFITIFLPLFLLAYYLTPNAKRSLIILIGSYAFYAWWRVDFMFLFVAVTIWNYFISTHIVKRSNKEIHCKAWLTLGIAGNLGVLGYFKYFNFGVDSLNLLLGYMGEQPITVWSVILPIGISFYIFQAISYLIDCYRRDTELAENFLDFAAFIAFFPQLIAGPVLRYKDVAGQFHSRTHTMAKFNEGVIRFAIGFCKKVFVADTIAPIADGTFAIENPTFADAWLGVFAYTMQLYFDFSGYSDMAIGLGLMMGFRFIENFNHPYISRSITEFWQRWHISLSTWLRDYLYIPLGGNRKGARRTYINIITVMILAGLWHGANWTFILWGAFHGCIMAIERYFGSKDQSPYPKLLAWAITILFVMIGWVLFRAENIAAAFNIYGAMIGLNGFGVDDNWLSYNLSWSINNLQIFTLISAYIIALSAPYIIKTKNDDGTSWAAKVPAKWQAIICFMFIFGICKLISQSYSPFLYFQF